MKSKKTIEKQLKKKGNQELVETIILAKKQEKWKVIAEILSGSCKKRPAINLEKLNKESKEGEKIAIPGKILSEGELNKKIKIIGFAVSKKALEKIKKAQSEFILLKDEIKQNPSASGVKILK